MVRFRHDMERDRYPHTILLLCSVIIRKQLLEIIIAHLGKNKFRFSEAGLLLGFDNKMVWNGAVECMGRNL